VQKQRRPIAKIGFTTGLTKSERLALALEMFSALPQAVGYRQAIIDMQLVLRQVESEHSTLPYLEEHGHAGLQLHLFAYHPNGSFWQTLENGNQVCQLASHYAEFWLDGGVAVYSRYGNISSDLVYCKPDNLLGIPVGTPIRKEMWK
jgi:hypothetical protein